MTYDQFSCQITHFFEFEPTLSQKKVIEGLSHFVTLSPPHSIYILRGYAGTGKSTLIGALVRALYSAGLHFRLLAPTGRAAKVLQSYCGFPAHTIHRTIYRQRITSDGDASFDIGYNTSRKGTFYIIDEASMISNSSEGYTPFGTGRLLDDLMEYCLGIEGSHILFVGDDAQLPPVGTELSPAMDPVCLQGYGVQVSTGTLTDIVRQESAGEIVSLSHILRHHLHNADIDDGSFPTPILPLPSTTEVTLVSPYDLTSLVEQSYRRVGKDETLIITRSNREAEQLNREIRFRSLDYDGVIVNGEELMVCRNNYLHLPLDEEDKPTTNFIANGELLHVEHAGAEHELYGFHFREAELRDSAGGIFTALLLLESLYSGVASLTSEQRQALYEGVVADYPGIRSRKALFEQIRKDPHLNALQVKYAYAMTCHKSQGGQWKEVYISFGYLTQEMIDRSFFRWLYTAMTRATERLYIIAPPEFLFGDYQGWRGLEPLSH